jgi:hypothetical protein
MGGSGWRRYAALFLATLVILEVAEVGARKRKQGRQRDEQGSILPKLRFGRKNFLGKIFILKLRKNFHQKKQYILIYLSTYYIWTIKLDFKVKTNLTKLTFFCKFRPKRFHKIDSTQELDDFSGDSYSEFVDKYYSHASAPGSSRSEAAVYFKPTGNMPTYIDANQGDQIGQIFA